MNAITTISEGPALTQQQARFVEELLNGTKPDEARDIAGYSRATHPNVILASPTVAKAIEIACESRMRGDLRVKAIIALDKLLNDDAPSATRFNAAKLILEHGANQPGIAQKPATEMTIDELEAFVRQKQDELKDVTPSNGA